MRSLLPGISTSVNEQLYEVKLLIDYSQKKSRQVVLCGAIKVCSTLNEQLGEAEVSPIDCIQQCRLAMFVKRVDIRA